MSWTFPGPCGTSCRSIRLSLFSSEAAGPGFHLYHYSCLLTCVLVSEARASRCFLEARGKVTRASPVSASRVQNGEQVLMESACWRLWVGLEVGNSSTGPLGPLTHLTFSPSAQRGGKGQRLFRSWCPGGGNRGSARNRGAQRVVLDQRPLCSSSRPPLSARGARRPWESPGRAVRSCMSHRSPAEPTAQPGTNPPLKCTGD